MSFTSSMMYISAGCIFIFYVYIGFSHAAPGASLSDASPGSAPEAGELAATPRKRSLTLGVTPASGGLATTTFQPPTADPSTATADSSRSSSHRRRSTDGQASLFTPDKSLQTLVSMVSQRSANDAWAADTPGSPFTSMETNQENLCNCSTGAEGIEDPDECDHNTGQCLCLSGYTGLQCEDCEEGHFTNGTSSCQPCACDSFGAVSPLCDSSGTCTCKTGIYGPKCDDCLPGFFHFSSTGCRPCQCNNHTSYCHPQSGVCLNCEGNTQGSNCEECRSGFYRAPAAAPSEPCLPCPCSNSSSTGSCQTDPGGSPVCDQCLPLFSGPRCERCQPGLYRSPAGRCVPCDCSGNADPQGDAQICHPDSGQCLRCINNTAGPQCQLCAPGFTGDARAHNCTRLTSRLGPPASPVPHTTAPPPTKPAPPTSTTAASPSNGSTPSPGQALLTSPGSPTDNTTAALTEVSWTQFNIIILAVIILVVVVLLGFVGGVYSYREYQNRKLNAPFWTIELKEDNISFSSYHDSIPNADVSGLLEDEANEVAPNGQLALTTQGNCYKA